MSRATLLVTTLALVCACGSKKPAEPTASAQKSKSTVAPKAKVVATPQPPTLRLGLEKVMLARITERCARKGGEPADDALVVAADAAAARTYQPPLVQAAAIGSEKAEKAGKKSPSPAAAKPTAAKPSTAKPSTAKPSPKSAGAPAVAGADLPAGTKATSRGRTYLDTAATKKWQADYAADVRAAEAWPAWKTQMDAEVAGCRWAAEIGLIDRKLIDRYTDVFVQVTCLQEKFRGTDGQIDETGHARAAIEVFKAHDFDARSFSQLGLLMARFPKVQAALYAVRAKACPDPRLKLDGAANEGDYVGTLRGALRGTITMTAKAGKLTGALVLTPGKRLKTPIKISLSGSIDGQRLHLNGVTGQDWLRLDCASTHKVCDWAGEVGFKKRKGTWRYRRPPVRIEPAGAVAKIPSGPAAKIAPVAPLGSQKAPAPAAGAAPPLPAAKVAGAPPSVAKPAIPVVGEVAPAVDRPSPPPADPGAPPKLSAKPIPPVAPAEAPKSVK